MFLIDKNLFYFVFSGPKPVTFDDRKREHSVIGINDDSPSGIVIDEDEPSITFPVPEKL
jgi:hypothetical protein